jgi:hypothetical protein
VINQLDKLAVLHRVYVKWGMMVGTTLAYMTCTQCGHLSGPIGSEINVMVEDDEDNNDDEHDDEENKEDDKDVGPVSGPRALSLVTLTSRHGMLTYLVSLGPC